MSLDDCEILYGEIMLYPESFLKWYFKTPDADEMRKNSEIDLDELPF